MPQSPAVLMPTTATCTWRCSPWDATTAAWDLTPPNCSGDASASLTSYVTRRWRLKRRPGRLGAWHTGEGGHVPAVASCSCLARVAVRTRVLAQVSCPGRFTSRREKSVSQGQCTTLIGSPDARSRCVCLLACHLSFSTSDPPLARLPHELRPQKNFRLGSIQLCNGARPAFENASVRPARAILEPVGLEAIRRCRAPTQTFVLESTPARTRARHHRLPIATRSAASWIGPSATSPGFLKSFPCTRLHACHGRFLHPRPGHAAIFPTSPGDPIQARLKSAQADAGMDRSLMPLLPARW